MTDAIDKTIAPPRRAGALPATDETVVCDGECGPIEGPAGEDVVFSTYRRSGSWSPALVFLIADRLFAGGRGTLIDVGAHIGLVTIGVLRRCGAQAIAFEPEPRNQVFLQRNLERQGLSARAQIRRCALDAENGRAKLALCRENSGDHRLVRGAAPPERACVEVATARLDDVFDPGVADRPIVLKLDCQGAEARVLSGAARTLADVDALVVEYWPAGLLRMGDHAHALQRLLLEFPYALVLGFQSLDGELTPTATLLSQLAFVPVDGSDEGFFDLLLSRRARLPPLSA